MDEAEVALVVKTGYAVIALERRIAELEADKTRLQESNSAYALENQRYRTAAAACVCGAYEMCCAARES